MQREGSGRRTWWFALRMQEGDRIGCCLGEWSILENLALEKGERVTIGAKVVTDDSYSLFFITIFVDT